MENKTFTISVYSENNVGLLNRISVIFLKRHINILSLNVSESEIENVSRFVIVSVFVESSGISLNLEPIIKYEEIDNDFIYKISLRIR